MASLAIAAAGAALTGSIGLGPQIGFLVGSVIGTLLFPPPQQEIVQEGPRLGDLSVSSSTYGTAIPLGYGTVRMSGNMIWSTQIQEVKNVQTSGGGGKGGLGGGGPKQTQITYSYFVDMAMSFSAVEANDVLRIWADGKVIYDKTGTRITRLAGLNFRFYPGNETQLPDSLIEADKGAGQVPGHRGLCYIVFDNLPLKNFGNRIPNITAELAFKSQTENLIDGGTELEPPLSFQNNFLTVDYVRRRAYTLEGSTPTLRIRNLDTLDEYRRVDGMTFSGFGAGNHAGRFTGNLYTGNGTRRLIRKWNPESFAETGSFGDDAISFGNSPDHFEAPRQLLEAQVLTPTGGVRNFLAQDGFITDPIGLLDADTMTYIWHESNPAGGLETTGIATSAFQQFGEALFTYALTDTGNDNNPIELWELTVAHNAAYDTENLVTSGVAFQQVDSITSGVWGNEGGGSPIGPILDLDDGGFVFLKRRTASTCQVFKWIKGQGVVWSTLVPDTTAPTQIYSICLNSVIENGRFGWVANSIAAMIDTSNGAIITSGVDLLALNVNTVQDACFWDATSETVVTQNSGLFEGELVRVFLERSTGLGVTLRSIVEDLSQRAGYNIAEDLDTTQLTDIVQGFLVGRQMTYRQAIEPLARAYLFESTESDDKIKFVKRGGAPIITIPESKLTLLDSNGEVVSEQRTQEVELPERIFILHLDKESDYQQGTQSSKRVRQPVPVMRSREEQSVSLPLVLTPTEAAQVAEKLLYSVWNERTSYKWKTAQEYLTLDPTDVIEIVLDSGVTFQTKVVQTTTGAAFDLEFEGIRESAATFDSDTVGQGNLGVPQKLPPAPSDTKTFILNIPLLRDVDDTGGISSRVYFGMNGFVTGWDGGSLLQSVDTGVTFNEISRALNALGWGTIAEALPPTDTPYQTNTEDVFTVFMQVGELESVTNAELLNDVNTAIVGSPDTNVWEIIGYRDVTEVSEGQYQVSNIIRAKRGTDIFVNDHATNEFFLPITADNLFAFTLALGQRNQALPYKGVGFSAIPENVSAISYTGLARDLKPYAPVQLAASLDVTDNIDMSWTRRTRIGGELVDGTGSVPLAEVYERYEIDIKDGPGGNVVGTYGEDPNFITAPVFQYTTAQQIADGLVPPLSTITFEVFQMSGSVGRGFGREVTITL